MSTSAIVAKLDLVKQLPSCSRNENEASNRLDVYTWGRIFENVAAGMDLRKALQLQSLHSEAYRAVEKVLRRSTSLKIHILEKEFMIQGSTTKKLSTAVEMIKYVLEKAENITSLELFLERPQDEEVDGIVNQILERENVKLKRLNIRRRFPSSVIAFAKIVNAHSETLKEVSKLTVHEAIIGLNDECQLDKLGLMTFELDNSSSNHQLINNLSVLAHRRAIIKKLSVTGYWGLDVTEEVVTRILRCGGVEVLRLTMMEPPTPHNMLMQYVTKVRNVKRVELVEVGNHPSKRSNKMTLLLETAREVFPCAAIELLRQLD